MRHLFLGNEIFILQLNPFFQDFPDEALRLLFIEEFLNIIFQYG